MKLLFLSALTALGVSFLVVHFFTPVNQVSTVAEESVYERVMRTGTIRCGYGLWPNLIEKDPNTGEFSGAHYEIVEQLGENLGLEIEWTEELDWAIYVSALNTDRIDMFCIPYTITPERIPHAYFTYPTQYFQLYLFARADDTRFDNNLAAVNDPAVTISLIEGEYGVNIANLRFPDANHLVITPLVGFAAHFMNVRDGKADVLISDDLSAKRFIDNHPGELRKAELPALGTYAAGMPVRGDAQQFGRMIDEGLRSMMLFGQIEHFYQKYEIDPAVWYLPALPFVQPE